MELFASSSTNARSVSFSLRLQKWRLHLPREARKLLQSPRMPHEAASSNTAALFRCGVVTETDNTQELLLPSWRSERANGVIPVGKLASLTPALPISRRLNMELETTHPVGDSIMSQEQSCMYFGTLVSSGESSRNENAGFKIFSF